MTGRGQTTGLEVAASRSLGAEAGVAGARRPPSRGGLLALVKALGSFNLEPRIHSVPPAPIPRRPPPRKTKTSATSAESCPGGPESPVSGCSISCRWVTIQWSAGLARGPRPSGCLAGTALSSLVWRTEGRSPARGRPDPGPSARPAGVAGTQPTVTRPSAAPVRDRVRGGLGFMPSPEARQRDTDHLVSGRRAFAFLPVDVGGSTRGRARARCALRTRRT